MTEREVDRVGKLNPSSTSPGRDLKLFTWFSYAWWQNLLNTDLIDKVFTFWGSLQGRGLFV
jgi:hypothetical protein